MAQILKFPYGRIRQEDERHEAKILKLPVKKLDDMFLIVPMMFAAWMALLDI